MKISKAVGIDLGTTRSLIGVTDLEDKQILLWRNEFGKATVPSVVQWDEQKKRFKVGDEALLTRHREPYPIHSIKRKMGFNIKIEHSGKKYRPEEIAAEILKYLKTCGEQLISEKYQHTGVEYLIDRAIVTVPAYFDQPKHEATRKAAELAGLETLLLLHEPTAAATYYCWRHGIKDGNFLVYDLGGGTFDVSVLKRRGGNFDVLGIAGDNVLGGDTFDMILAEHIIKTLDKGKFSLKLDMENNPEDQARFEYFVHRAEAIKKKLSLDDETLFSDASCPLPDKAGNSINVELKITRPQFEKLIAEKIKFTIDICHQAIEKAKEKAKGVFKGLEDIDYILLVGGSTRIPYVRQVVKEQLCALDGQPGRAKAEDISTDEPDECVALGAGLLAAAAGGIIYHDEEKDVCLHLEGASIAESDEYHMKGSVFKPSDPKPKAKKSPFWGYSLSLSQDGDEDLEVVEIGEKGSFKFEEVFLNPGEISKLTLILRDPASQEVAKFSRNIGQGKGIDRETPSANAKNIWVYAQNRKGEQVRQVIIESGAPIPCEREFDFTTTHSDRVLFKIYQGDIEIKEASQTFESDQPLGTKGHLSISMDRLGNMVIRSIVGELKPFVMELQPPPPPPPPTKADAEKVLKEFDAAKQQLPPAKRKLTEKKVEKLYKDLEAALNHNDHAATYERMEELRRITDEIAGAKPQLHPPKEELEALVAETRNLVHKHRDKLANADDILKNIDVQMEKGNLAYQDSDPQAWSECFRALKDLEDYIQKQVVAQQDPEKRPPLRLLLPLYARQLIVELEELSRSCPDQSLQSEAQKQIESLDSVPMLFATDQEAQAYIPTLQVALKFKEKMERAMGKKTDSSSRGLPGI